MRLRPKILSGFLILALMLSLASAWSIYELRSTSTAVEDILAENYRSINAGKMMLEALEREDSAVLLGMLGRWPEGGSILALGDSLFQAGFHIAAHNITIPGEEDRVHAIEAAYGNYKKLWNSRMPDATREDHLTWYFETPHRAFLQVKSAVHELIDLNAEVMYGTANRLHRGGNRAVMPGIVAVISALVFSLMFSYFVNLSVVRPIVRISSGVKGFIKDNEKFSVQIEGNDEISDLANSIRTLTSRIAGQRADLGK